MIFNTPAVDYWRATTSKLSVMDSLVTELIGNDAETGEYWRFLQYEGERHGSICVGSGLQHGRPSYIVDISGEAADDCCPVLSFSDMNMTRLDLQMTIPKPKNWDTLEFLFEMELGDWPGAERGVKAVINRGDDTVYIGSRVSERFIRVYVKEKNFVRFEVEYKKQTAKKVWNIIKSYCDRKPIAAILLGEVERLPQSGFLEILSGALKKHTESAQVIEIERTDATDINRLKWLASLLPTIERMANDHDYGHMVTSWLLEIVDRKLFGELSTEVDTFGSENDEK